MEWLPVIGTLLGTIVGGAIAFHISARQLKHQLELDERKRQLSNFESIHKILSSISLEANHLRCRAIMHRKHGTGMSSNSDSHSGEKKATINDAMMLVDFYAPSLRPDLNIIHTKGTTFYNVFLEIGVLYTVDIEKKTDQKVKDLFVRLGTCETEISKACEAAKTKLTALVEMYSHPV